MRSQRHPWLLCTRGRPADQNAQNQRASLRTNPRNNSRLHTAWAADEMVARHGGKGAQPHDQGRPECGQCRQGLGPEPPGDVPRLKVVRDHDDELVRTNWPMQLIDLRVNTWWRGQVRSY